MVRKPQMRERKAFRQGLAQNKKVGPFSFFYAVNPV